MVQSFSFFVFSGKGNVFKGLIYDLNLLWKQTPPCCFLSFLVFFVSLIASAEILIFVSRAEPPISIRYTHRQRSTIQFNRYSSLVTGTVTAAFPFYKGNDYVGAIVTRFPLGWTGIDRVSYPLVTRTEHISQLHVQHFHSHSHLLMLLRRQVWHL